MFVQQPLTFAGHGDIAVFFLQPCHFGRTATKFIAKNNETRVVYKNHMLSLFLF
jgi:hypothetical protein